MIKEFHKSKNLFDETYPDINVNIHEVIIRVPNGEYTLSTTTPLNNNGYANLFLSQGTEAPVTSVNGVWNEQSRTITVTNGELKISYRNIDGVTPINYNTMLNEGSTALPYEPYFTPVWKSVSYAKSISGAQTYTKFPIVLRTTEQSIPTWSVKGNMIQSGTPTPTSPITPQECGERTDNMFDKSNPNELNAYFANGVINEANGYKMVYVPCEPNTEYTVSMILTYRFSIAQFDQLPTYGATNLTNIYRNNDTEVTLTTEPTAAYLVVFLYTPQDTVSLTDIYDSLMINKGEPRSYEPYGYKIPIVSGGVTTNVYLSEPLRKIGNETDTVNSDGTITRRIGTITYDGTENWTNQYPSASKTCSITKPAGSSITPQATNFMCNSFIPTANNNAQIGEIYSGTSYINFNYDGTNDLTTWKAYLATNPVTVWYLLTTPTTETITAPSIPTTSGLNTIDVATTLKPSEMSLTYDGYKLCKRQRYSRTENLFDAKLLRNNKNLNPTSGLPYNYDGRIANTVGNLYSNVTTATLTFSVVGITTTEVKAIYSVFNDTTLVRRVSNISNGDTLDLSNGNKLYICFYSNIDITTANVSNLMLNTGSTAKPYQPYLVWK